MTISKTNKYRHSNEKKSTRADETTWSAGRRPGESDESISRWFGVNGGTEPPGGDLSWAVAAAAAPPKCEPSGTDPVDAFGVFCSKLTRQAATSGGRSLRPDNIDRLTWLAPLWNRRREAEGSGSDSIPTPRIWLAKSFAENMISFIAVRLPPVSMVDTGKGKTFVYCSKITTIEKVRLTCLFTTFTAWPSGNYSVTFTYQ